MKYAQQILTNNLLTEMFLGMLPQHRLGQPDYKFDSHEPGLIHFKDAFQDELDFLSSDDAFKSFYITDFEVLDSNKKPREPYGKLWRQFCTTFLFIFLIVSAPITFFRRERFSFFSLVTLFSKCENPFSLPLPKPSIWRILLFRMSLLEIFCKGKQFSEKGKMNK